MAIDVPYSYLLRDGELAWTCGQLALDAESNTIRPGDLVAQSSIVCDHVEAILERAALSRHGVRRLYLYYVHSTDDAKDAMLDAFTERLGSSVDPVPIAVPHFYYDGVVLEVDVWWGGPAELRWVDGPGGPSRLSEHVICPPDALTEHLAAPDPGAVINGGPHSAGPRSIGIDLIEGVVRTDIDNSGELVIVLRRSGPFLWLQGRSTNENKGLVQQTEVVMKGLAKAMAAIEVDFADVVKSTAHYVGGSSAAELHDNMAVRNAYYTSPGPASTGLPVFGFADPASRIVVDLTLVKR